MIEVLGYVYFLSMGFMSGYTLYVGLHLTEKLYIIAALLNVILIFVMSGNLITCAFVVIAVVIGAVGALTYLNGEKRVKFYSLIRLAILIAIRSLVG